MDAPTSVLVIDDDPTFRSIVRHILQRDGYQVLESASTSEALETAARELPSVILLDLMMPQGLGQDFILDAKNHAALKDIPILVCSGRTSVLDERTCLRLGAAGYIRKPFEVKDFRQKVREAADRASTGLRSGPAAVERLEPADGLVESIMPEDLFPSTPT